MIIDHVVMVVPDAIEAADVLRGRHGLGSERGPYHAFAGTRSHSVPLSPPTYLEFVTIENRDVARRSKTGRRVLACEAAGFGLLAWAVLVEDLETVSKGLAIEVVDYTIPHGDGTLRGWRSVTGPPHLPFFIDYPNNGDRVGRWQAMFQRVGHTCSPGGFSELTISGSEDEMLEAVERQRTELARFVSPQVAELLSSPDGEHLLAGHRAYITCLSAMSATSRHSRRPQLPKISSRCCASTTPRSGSSSRATRARSSISPETV